MIESQSERSNDRSNDRIDGIDNSGIDASASVDSATIALSLISHTNVGKTTLLRTLLRRDVGDVADRAHVTELAESHVLIETPQGDALRLWDTPGFGDSARLLKRLRASDNPIGFLLTQVWDRLTDRPFWSSQQAIRNARDESDIILYLVNAAEDPAAAGYVDAEMQILAWMKKPVLLLLNQIGPPREREREATDESLWRSHVSTHPVVCAVLSLDAFARCWVQENTLLEAVGGVVDETKRAAFARLHAGWRARNLDVFDASMRVLAEQFAAVAADREKLAVAQGFQPRRWLASLVRDGFEVSDPDDLRAMEALGNRLDVLVRETTDRMLALHGLSGRAADTIVARVAGSYDVAKPADAGKSGVIGGVVSGAIGGLAADVAAGGLTFGAGALIGGILGALGATGVAKAYNLARRASDGRVGWSATFIAKLPVEGLLRYLAIAHYGRGRGDWTESEYPAHWQPVVEAVIEKHGPRIATIIGEGENGGASIDVDRSRLLFSAMAAEVLVEMYGDAARFLLEGVHPDG